jgi:two-component system response regulator
MFDRPLEIFVAEDNRADLRYLQIVLDDVGVSYNLHVAEDGEEAVDFFRRQGRFAAAPTPDIAFLDLNLPRLDGVQILASVPQGLPLCILTGSPEEEAMVVHHFNLDVRCYIVKPVDGKKVLDALGSYDNLKDYAAHLALQRKAHPGSGVN